MKHGKSVAIVGVGGIFPMSPTLERFWENITAKVNTSRQPPPGRWLLEPDEVYAPTVGAPDKVYSKQGCFIDDEVLSVPPAGLDLDPAFLAGLDPLFRLLLLAGSRAFADARTEQLNRERVGVIIGNLALPSEKSSALGRELLGRTFAEQLLGQAVPAAETATAPLNRYVAGLPAGLLAKALGLGGTAYTLDAACASSLYAIKLAVDELLAGRADAMLTGGLSRPDSLYTQMGFSQLHALSPTGTCSPFDQNGDGLVVGEGCGIFLLKRTEDALRDGDQIHAVIRGIGLSNDLGGSLLAPAAEGQLRAMRAAYAQAGWNPSDVDLIECHATGTPVGDAVEFASLKTLWGESGWKRGQCVIGSVKSNIGHLLTAAGSAALTKVLLALKSETLPPTANFSAPAKGLDFAPSPFRLLDAPTPWQPRKAGLPRRAAISAFGFGGINAHLLLEEWRPAKPAKSSVAFPASFQRKPQPVAIVGMGAHFGPWDSLDAFSQRVLGSSAAVTPTAPARWWGAQQSRWFAAAGLDRTPFSGYFVPEVAAIPGEFRIPPKELEEMLPRQLLMLKVAEAALRDAGLKHEDLLHAGVFIGTGLDLNATSFSFRWSIQQQAKSWAKSLGLELSSAELDAWIEQLRTAAGPALTANRTMGALGSIVASRIAKEFRIGGPSFTLSSEENSGLRALEVAVRALQQGSITRAVVGAVDLAGDLRAALAQHAERPCSATGQLRPFDPAADGTLLGEGAAAIILKSLEEAQRDGDRIYAVIKGIGSATGGALASPVPAAKAYTLALERTFAEAGSTPAEVSYLETHGSAIPAEDALEAASLGAFFGPQGSENPCWVGSVKADIGHSGAAAGLAGLIKTALCLHQQLLAPLRHSRLAGPRWSQGARDFLFPAASQYWLRNRAEGPRKALVSGIGVDGSCSHALLEGYEEKGSSSAALLSPLGSRSEALLAVEAETPALLAEQVAELQRFVAAHAELGLESLAAAWFAQHPLDRSKKLALALVAGSRAELGALLEQAVRHLAAAPGQRSDAGSNGLAPALRDRLFYAPEPLAGQGEVAFIFPGSGNHFAGMGRELSAEWPAIYRQQDQKSGFLARQFLPQHFWGETLVEPLHDQHNALVIGQVALGTAVSDLVRSFGIEPQAVSGYSLGESAGLFSFGAWQDRDAMAQRLRDSKLFTEQLAGPCRAARSLWRLGAKESVDWSLGIVAVPAESVRAALIGLDRVYLLIVNTHAECVIGGQRQAVEALVAKLGCHFLPLRGVTTVHCEVAQSVAQPYRELHLFPTTPPAGVRFYSCALGRSYPLNRESAADVILAQALETIDYTAVIEQAYQDGVRIFLEMGPGNSCSRMIGRILGDRPHLARSGCYPGPDPTSLLLRLLAACLVERLPVDLSRLYPQLPSVSAPAIKGPAIRTTIGGSAFVVPKPPEKVTPLASPPITPMIPMPPMGSMGIMGVIEPTTPLAESNPLLDQLQQTLARQAESHEAYLRFSATMGEALSETIRLQMALLQQMGASGVELPSLDDSCRSGLPAAIATESRSYSATQTVPPAFDRSMCMEFAVGSIAKMLGPEFAEIDSYPTRVRLPDEPLMLVDRIVSIEGKARSMTSGRVITEHDVTPGRWYLDAGRIPTCIAVEAGQADLFLSGYLGIDFITKGLAVYRLLDAEVTFHRSLPVVGETIRYDIHIDHFFRQDQTYLFRFHFEGTVNGEPLLSMTKGCAGFFSAAELAAGKGIIQTKLDLMPKPGIRPADWRELAPLSGIESYSDSQIAALRQGNLAGCFGPAFANLPLKQPYTLPEGLLKLVDRVVELNPTGGRFGLGTIRAEADIHPDDWFLTSHFCDDHVMPGTLMYECCLHTLRIYLLRMGWIGESGSVAYEPVPGVASQLKCRGQVVETTKVVTYEVTIKELGYRPEPYAIVDALMYADGKPIVGIGDMTVRLSGLNRARVEGLWSGTVPLAGTVPLEPALVKGTVPQIGTVPRPALYDYERILAYSVGNPSDAFGEPYKIFDAERKIARLPGPPFQFLDRIVAIDGAPWVLKAGVTIEAEYDVPPDAWYFKAGRQPEMPFAILLETGLQPCGWLAAYLGSALTSPIDLSFRNLDGNAVQHRPVTPHSGTLTTRVKITKVASSGGMIIQGYDFEIRDAHGPVYNGDTVFGFFSKEALSQQVGVRDAQRYLPSPADSARSERFAYPTEAPYPDTQLRMVDSIDCFIPDGGPQGLGFIRGTKQVDPAEWFFKAHFYQDPVCPGSLGLESFLQLLKVAAVKRWNAGPDAVLEAIALGQRHKWNYRGQIIPTNQEVTIEAVITAVDDRQRLLTANGFLIVDGKVIYQMHDFSLRLR